METSDKTMLLSATDPTGTPRGATVKNVVASLPGENPLFGLIALDTISTPSSADVLMTGDPAAVVGLIQPTDTNPHDNRFYATSALVIDRVSRQILGNDSAIAGSLDGLQLAADDRILAIDSQHTASPDDVRSCLMAYSPGDRVLVTVASEGTTHTMETTLTETTVAEATDLHNESP